MGKRESERSEETLLSTCLDINREPVTDSDDGIGNGAPVRRGQSRGLLQIEADINWDHEPWFIESTSGARLCRRPAATPMMGNALRLVEDDTAALRSMDVTQSPACLSRRAAR